MSWDEQLVEDFLQEYRKHECLWNPFHRQFHDCLAKGEALKEVVKNLRFGIGVQDCLRLLKCIRAKYIEDQTKSLLTFRSNICKEPQPKWQQIVESILKKIVGDESRKSDYLAPIRNKQKPALKILFRHTIPSGRKVSCKCPAKQNQTSSKVKRRRRKRKKPRGKLERRGRCCNNAQRDMDPCSQASKAQDCSRSEKSWCQQRDDYLDKLKWTKPCQQPIECPGLTSHIERVSRIENIGKDPCTSTPVYMCPNRATHVNCNQRNESYGRRRRTDIQPTITEPRSCRSPPRPTCPPRKTSPERSPCSSAKRDKPTCDKKTSSGCCPCSDKVDDKCVVDKKPSIPKVEDACTRDTCPSYTRVKTNDSTICMDKSKACPALKDTDYSLRNVRFDQCVTSTPRVAARFENGVLEAYSQFKVVFPSQDQPDKKKRCCTQKVQTDSTTRERAIGVCSKEFLREKTKCPGRKDVLVGTDEDFIECCPDDCDAGEVLEPENTCHDYVLLTPGGKYVPLVKTKLEGEGKTTECTCNNDAKRRELEVLRQRTQETCKPDATSGRNCEKQTLDDEKCPSTTTKLLLRCLEHMLHLEEQQEKAKPVDTKEDGCDPCRRKERRELARNPSSNCLPCTEERSSPRGKLTQNFLEILKCAMQLDNGCKKDDDDDDACGVGDRQDDCRCCCDVVDNDKQKDQTIQCEANNDTYVVIASSTPISSSENVECDAKLRNRGCEKVDDDKEKITQKKISTRETSVGGADFIDAESKATQDEVVSASVGIQCDARRSRDKNKSKVVDNLVRCTNSPAHDMSAVLKCDDGNDYGEMNVKRVPATTLPPQRDQTLACLRADLQRDKEFFDKTRVSYVKCNQVYRSYVVRSPATSPTRLSGVYK